MRNKWGTKSKEDKEMHVVLLISRNKDNAGIANFKERRESFVTKEDMNSDYLRRRFYDFLHKGAFNEVSRMYYSVNSRDEAKVERELIHFLIDNPDFNLCALDGKVAGIAAGSSNAKSAHWMFDFDDEDYNKANKFCRDIRSIDETANPAIYPTPHGYAIIVEHGFDTRKLLEVWGDKVTFKRDDLLCVRWARKIK